MYEDGPGPSLLSREIYAEAGHLHGDVGARILIASHPEWVEEVPVEGDGSPRHRHTGRPRMNFIGTQRIHGIRLKVCSYSAPPLIDRTLMDPRAFS